MKKVKYENLNIDWFALECIRFSTIKHPNFSIKTKLHFLRDNDSLISLTLFYID